MMLKGFFDISTGFRFSKISVECSVHSCSCPCLMKSSPMIKKNKANMLFLYKLRGQSAQNKVPSSILHKTFEYPSFTSIFLMVVVVQFHNASANLRSLGNIIELPIFQKKQTEIFLPCLKPYK